MRNLIKRTDRISKAPEQNRQQDLGSGMIRDMITENINKSNIAQGIMKNPAVGTMMEGFNTLKEGYEKVKPYIPDEINTPNIPGEFYGYEAPVGPGTLTFGADKGFNQFYGGYQFSFDDGGIVDTPQAQDMMKKQLSDEQKDYLYDFMLDFMMKEKMREQQEMEGRVPMFNYFDMEV